MRYSYQRLLQNSTIHAWINCFTQRKTHSHVIINNHEYDEYNFSCMQNGEIVGGEEGRSFYSIHAAG